MNHITTKTNDSPQRANRRAWWLLAGLLAVLTMAGFAPTVAAQEGDTYTAHYPVSVNVDGDFSEWQDIETRRVTTGPQVTGDPAHDGAFEFAALADADHLYVMVRVEDSNVVAGQNGLMYWLEDSVEIYVNGSGDLERTSYTPSVVQLTIPAANIGLPVDQSVIAGINHERVPARAAVVGTDNGYAMEVAIPLRTDVWTLDPNSDFPVGFQIQVNGSSGGDRDVKLSWSPRDQTEDRSYADPSVFGQLVFEGGDGNSAPQQAVSEPTAVPPTEPPASQGNFSVQGTQILTPEGQPFVAKGVNVSGYQWVWTRPTAPDADLIVDCWGFNLVRVNSFLFRGQVPYEQFDVNNDLDAIVQAFTSRGVVVVFEGHDRIGEYYEGDDLTALVNWFTDLANRYKDNPYVWFDVMNEPGGWQEVNAEKWLRVHQEVIRAIRNTGNNNIIIVEGAHGGQDASGQHGGLVSDADSAILSLADQILAFGGQSYSNIVFSIHTYDQWNHGDAKLADFFDRVHGRNLAMIVGEYGVRTNVDTIAAFRSLFNTAAPRGIGRVVWHWDGGDDNDLTTGTSQGGGWEINDCANPTNLSEMGQTVWNDNHGG